MTTLSNVVKTKNSKQKSIVAKQSASIATQIEEAARLPKLTSAGLKNVIDKNQTTQKIQIFKGKRSHAFAVDIQALLALADYIDHRKINITLSEKILTTTEVANLLGVSRPYVVKLLENGAIPYRKVGRYRRVREADALVYKAQRDNDSSQAMTALIKQAQELGMGYD